MRISQSLRIALVLALAASTLTAAVALGGCAKKKASSTPEPKIKPPAIAEAGVLRVGLDLTYPPFGGEDKGKQAGIDVDVAQALAASLGVRLQIVSVPATAAVSALASGTVDAIMSVPIEASTVTSTSIVGSYIADGPAFFTTAEETVTAEGIGERATGAQQGSQAFWVLQDLLGEDVVQGYATLRDAFEALADGKLSIVAGDAVIGAYIARDFPSVLFSGQLGTARPLAVAVAKDNAALADAIRTSLDGLASDGVLRAVRTKWVGDLPELALPKE